MGVAPSLDSQSISDAACMHNTPTSAATHLIASLIRWQISTASCYLHSTQQDNKSNANPIAKVHQSTCTTTARNSDNGLKRHLIIILIVSAQTCVILMCKSARATRLPRDRFTTCYRRLCCLGSAGRTLWRCGPNGTTSGRRWFNRLFYPHRAANFNQPPVDTKIVSVAAQSGLSASQPPSIDKACIHLS